MLGHFLQQGRWDALLLPGLIRAELALDEAASKGHPALVKMLFDLGFSVQESSQMDQLISEAAASKGPRADPAATINLSLQQGATLGGTDHQGRGALQYVDLFHFTVVRLLFDHGASPLIRDSLGNSPLALAAYHRYRDGVALLMQAIDAQDEQFEVVAPYVVEAKRESTGGKK